MILGLGEAFVKSLPEGNNLDLKELSGWEI